jgi:NAD(P)-dependent dehydrogenase (short-subunit alcohol dehydrogenase family)
MKLAVVTGSSGGIGQSVCKVLAVRARDAAASATARQQLARARARPPR